VDLTLDLQQDGVIFSYTDTATDESGVSQILYDLFISSLCYSPPLSHHTLKDKKKE
jgi:hypothetical protein